MGFGWRSVAVGLALGLFVGLAAGLTGCGGLRPAGQVAQPPSQALTVAGEANGPLAGEGAAAGTAAWTAAAAQPPGGQGSAVGGLADVARRWGGFVEGFACGGREVVVGHAGMGLQVAVGAQVVGLWRQPEGGEGFYGSAAEQDTAARWRPGELALRWLGVPLPGCVLRQAAAGPLKARGVDPPWELEADRFGVRVRWAAHGRMPAEAEAVALSPQEPLRLARPLRLGDGVGASTLTVWPEVCVDAQSLLPMPYRVVLRRDGSEHQGCGGEPLALLQGRPWRVRAPQEAAGAVAELRFEADGWLRGRAGCNAFSAPYRMEGEFLRLGPLRSTRKACPGGAMEAERALWALLVRVSRFEVPALGRLRLLTEDGRALELE